MTGWRIPGAGLEAWGCPAWCLTRKEDMTQVERQMARPLSPSERAWLRVRSYLREHRYDLGVAAAAEYRDVAKVEGSNLLTARRWLPAEPVPLDRIELGFAPESRFNGITGTDPASESVRPLRPDGSRYQSYSAAINELAPPKVFENRGTYRLLSADIASAGPRLTFGRGAYFDGIDTGEAVAHEYASRTLASQGDGELRAAIGSPVDPGRRPTNVAISSLTIRHDRSSGDARVLLHWRDPAKVGHAGGLYQVIPVGIFQPASDHAWNEQNDFSLWRCLLREFAEELLGQAEPDATHGPIDYDNWPFAARLDAERRAGAVHAYCLGIGVDPLTLATDLLSVVVIDAPVFDEIFGGLVEANAEGIIPASRSEGAPGVPFVDSEVARLTQRAPMQAAGAAAIASAWTHRQKLLAQ